MVALALFAFIIAMIIGLVIKVVEVTAKTGSNVVRKSSDFAHYVKDNWKEANEELRRADEELRDL
jgi:predicted class III extradiol MEMO1 family dioxygenase